MPDCGDNSCQYAKKRTGMRTNGGCRCDLCDHCGARIKPGNPGLFWHRQWCNMSNWIPPHHRGKMTIPDPLQLNKPLVAIQPLRPLLVMHAVKIEDDGTTTD